MPTIQQIKYRTILNSHCRFTTEFIIQFASGEVGMGAAPQGETIHYLQKNEKGLWLEVGKKKGFCR